MGIPHHGRTSVASAEHWRTPSVHAARVLHVHVGNINGLEYRALFDDPDPTFRIREARGINVWRPCSKHLLTTLTKFYHEVWSKLFSGSLIQMSIFGWHYAYVHASVASFLTYRRRRVLRFSLFQSQDNVSVS